jgi:hypothetical protein
MAFLGAWPLLSNCAPAGRRSAPVRMPPIF